MWLKETEGHILHASPVVGLSGQNTLLRQGSVCVGLVSPHPEAFLNAAGCRQCAVDPRLPRSGPRTGARLAGGRGRGAGVSQIGQDGRSPPGGLGRP